LCSSILACLLLWLVRAWMNQPLPDLEQRFRIDSLLGKGAFYTVFRAFDRLHNVSVALKVHDMDPNKLEDKKIRQFEQHLYQEVVKPSCPHVLRPIESGMGLLQKRPVSCSVMPLGADLRRVLLCVGILSEGLVYFIAKDIASGLSELSAAGFVYRDLKPDNVVLLRSGEVSLSDVNSVELKTVRTCEPANHSWSAPESRLGTTYDLERADAYSLGMLMFVCLFGGVPPAGDLDRFDFSTPEPLSEPCIDVLKRLLAMDPLKRPTFTELLQHNWFAHSAFDADRRVYRFLLCLFWCGTAKS